jgi:hypothetical protein
MNSNQDPKATAARIAQQALLRGSNPFDSIPYSLDLPEREDPREDVLTQDQITADDAGVLRLFR